MAEDNRYRLPRTVLPSHYRIAVSPDLEAATFKGTTEITVEIREPTAAIVCNAVDLEIHSAVLTESSGRELAGSVTLDADTERATITLPDTVTPGKAVLTLTHSGVLNDKLRGFYRSTYKDETGSTRVIAATQFEATDARRAFPCWDEPDAKATFEVELLVPLGLTAVSNTAVVEERPVPGGRWIRFAPTMTMSTYLAAWAVGPLEVTDPVDVDGVPLRVVCAPGRQHLAGFALEVGAHALRWLASYFDLPYPSDKLDFVALPDFASGAMENLGCVTFRETAVLVDPETASREELERVADVVCHEVAHMWFGDLVTMKWWNGIWLNEAFATFMEASCVQAFRPEWERWISFSNGKAAAMAVDGLASTRPIEYPVVSPDDAEGMFDLLTYEKGGSVLRMLETYLGPDRFRDGIRHYLRKHRYDNTETTDLWDALEATTGEPVRAMMDTWIFQGGHPVVRAHATGSDLELSQRRFRYSPSPADDDARWDVPIRYRYRTPEGWRSDRALLTGARFRVPVEGASSTIVVNDGGWGFFRTDYDPDLLGRITLNLAELGAIERFNLVSDAWAGVLAGSTPLGALLRLVVQLTFEPDESVWDAALGPLDTLHRIADDHARDGLGAVTRRLVRPQFDRLGWSPAPEEGERVGSLRAKLLSALGTIGSDADVQAQAAELHAAYLKDRAAVPKDLVTAVVAVVAWTGGEAEFSAFLDRARHPATPQEEVRYLYALPRFRHAELLRRALEVANTEARSQNAPFMVGVALSNRWVGSTAWEWLKANWDGVLARFPDNSISRMLEGVVGLSTPDLAADVHQFLGAHPVPHAQLLIAQILERLDINTAFRQRESAQLDDLLD